MKLRRSARRHQAGTDATLWHEFHPGDRVLTPEGIFGRVVSVEDGFVAGAEHYIVELDAGLGGGEYSASELRHPTSDNVEPGFVAKTAERVEDGDIIFVASCDDCRFMTEGVIGQPSGDSARKGYETHLANYPDHNVWTDESRYDDTRLGAKTADFRLNEIAQQVRQLLEAGMAHADIIQRLVAQGIAPYQEVAEALQSLVTGAKTAENGECLGVEPHYASDDYPELSEILVERPPLPHSERVGSKKTAADPRRFQGIFPEIDDRVQLDEDGDIGEVIENRWEDDGEGGLVQHFKVQYPDGTIGYGNSRQFGWLNLDEPQYEQNDDDEYLAAKEAGFWDKVLDPIADYMIKHQDERYRYNPDTGQMASYDWCRFRRDRRCFYPRHLNQKATEQMGYAVWIPEDRGFCPRETWEDQKACPAPSEPGPNANDPRNLTDATIPFEQGGQRYDQFGRPVEVDIYSLSQRRYVTGERGVKTYDNVEELGSNSSDTSEFAEDIAEMVTEYRQKKNPYSGGNPYSATRDPEFSFHMTAAWTDVRDKAVRIRQAGHVRIISASPAFLVGEVRGDTNIYQTTLQREPGTNRVATWECGCAWAAYSWGRSGRWKKYEGRMCSHALALHYEAQSRGWMGQTVFEDAKMPDWRKDPSITVQRPGDYKKPDYEWRIDAARRTASRVCDWCGEPAYYAGRPTGDEGLMPSEVYYSCVEHRPELVEYAGDEINLHVVGTLRPLSTDASLHIPPALGIARDLYRDGDTEAEIAEVLSALGVSAPGWFIKQAMAAQPFEVRYHGETHKVTDIHGEMVVLDDGSEVPASEVEYPDYDPIRGLALLKQANPYLNYRACDNCGRRMAPYFPRTRAPDGERMLCETCAKFGSKDEPEPPTLGMAKEYRIARTAQADSEDGCMIALRPPAHILDALEGDTDEDYDNLHVTVAYLGKAADIDHNLLNQAVAEWSRRWPAFPAKLSGYGVFENGEDRVLVALVDMPGFEDARGELIDKLASYGIHPMRNHGYTPHLTLAYGHQGSAPEALPDDAKGDFQFSSVYVVTGQTWEEFPLTGRVAKSSAYYDPLVPDEECEHCGETIRLRGDGEWVHPHTGSPYCNDDGEATPKEAELRDEPEPALPRTDGIEEENDEIADTGREIDPNVQDIPNLRSGSIQPGDSSLSWLMEGNHSNQSEGQGGTISDHDIAQAAREALKKHSLKDFTPAEQAELIAEGEDEGVTASNLDKLDITGTHYEALESAFQEEESADDLWMLL